MSNGRITLTSNHARWWDLFSTEQLLSMLEEIKRVLASRGVSQ